MSNIGIRIGAGATDDITLGRVMSAIPADTFYMTLEYPAGTDYVVAGGKTLYITKIIYSSLAANGGFRLGWGNEGVPSQVGAPAGEVLAIERFMALVADFEYEKDVFITIPAGKYPFVLSIAERIHFKAFGIEV